MHTLEWGSVLRWCLVVQAWAIPCHALCSILFTSLPHRGVLFVKPLAVLLVGFGSWMLYAWLHLPFVPWLPWLTWMLLCAGTWILWRRDRRRSHVVGESKPPAAKGPAWLWAELAFWAAFLFWLWATSLQPGVFHTEQPMDFMFINSLWNSRQFPPQDAWLAGQPISYYYLGYWLLTAIAKAAAVPPDLAYHIGQATWFAFLIAGALGLGGSLAGLARRRFDWPAGMVTAATVAFMGNLQAVRDQLAARGIVLERLAHLMEWRSAGVGSGPELPWYGPEWRSWWWWHSTRVLADRGPDGGHLEVITEFPFFSFLLGDNHPHVLSVPFLFLSMGLALQWLVGDRGPTNSRIAMRWLGWLPGGSAEWIRLGLAATLVAAAFFMNTWDVLPVCGMLAAAAVLGSPGIDTWRRRIVAYGLAVATLLTVAAVMVVPYLLTSRNQVEGVAFNLLNPSRPGQFLLVWVPLLSGAVLSLWMLNRNRPRQRTGALEWGAGALLLGLAWMLAATFGPPAHRLAAVLGIDARDLQTLIADRWSLGWMVPALLLVLLGWSCHSLRQAVNTPRQADPSAVLHAVLLTGGVLLLAVPEFLFLQDAFGPLARMNTVFKFHYQAWVLLAVAGSTAIVMTIRERRRISDLLATGFVGAMLAVGLLYPVSALGGKAAGTSQPPSLNALRDLQGFEPARAAAVGWIRAYTDPQTVIVEAPGISYRPETSWISGLTGRPTLMGWQGHEAQWRGRAFAAQAAGRVEALEGMYARHGIDTVVALMHDWNVEFLLLGPAEEARFAVSEQRRRELQSVLVTVWSVEPYRLLARPDAVPGD